MKSLVAYHGTNKRFSQFDETKARIVNDFYGGGIAYFTDTVDVAKSYAASMFRKFGGERYVYEVDLRLSKTFDVDDKFRGYELVKLIGNKVEDFARGAKLLNINSDRLKVLRELREGAIELTGEQVFRGISQGMTKTAEAKNRLDRLGYDSLRYNGGDHMGVSQKHNVYLAYHKNSITIKNRYIISNKPVALAEKQEVYSFIY